MKTFNTIAILVAGLIAMSTEWASAAVHSLTVSTQSSTNSPGGVQTYLVTASGNGAAIIDFTVTNVLPPGVSVTFDPNPIAPGGGAWSTNTVLTVVTSANTPPGTYPFTVKATPTGGSSFAFAPALLVVNWPTRTDLSSSASLVSYGEAVTFTALVTPTGTGMPTGTVTFMDGNTLVGSATLEPSGLAIFTTALLSAGSPHSITAVYSGDSAFQGSTSAAVAATVNPVSLSVVGVIALDKIYDGTTGAQITVASAALQSLPGAENLTLNSSGTAAAFVDENVGEAKTVAVTGLTLSGPGAGNYSLVQPVLTASITPRDVGVTGIAAANKVYDGTTSAALNTSGATLQGVIPGDALTLNPSLMAGAFVDSSVGTSKLVLVSGAGLAGPDAVNYNLTQPVLTASISPAPLTIRADHKEKVSGMPNPPLTASYEGLVAGETAQVLTTSPTLQTTATTASPDGDYPITVSGATAQNYSITFAPGTLTVVTAPVLTAISGTGGTFTFSLPTALGQRYQLEARSELDDTGWVSVGEILTGTGEPLVGTHPAERAHQFFRVQVLPHAN